MQLFGGGGGGRPSTSTFDHRTTGTFTPRTASGGGPFFYM